jgi:hypothetical protein
VIGAAIGVARIATGEAEDAPPEDGKNAAAKALGAKGGAARAKAMTAEKRAEIARKAAEARWEKNAVLVVWRRMRSATVPDPAPLLS